MGRVAVLEIENGDCNQGFVVSLQLYQDNGSLSAKIKGRLPANPDIESFYICWQTSFRGLRTPYHNDQTSHRGIDDDWQIDQTLVTNRSTYSDIEACRQFVRNLEKRMKNWLQQSADEGWQSIREILVKELANKSDEIWLNIQSKATLLWRLPWYEWDLLEKNPDVGITFSSPEFYQSKRLVKPVNQKDKVRLIVVFGDSRGINLRADDEEIKSLPDTYSVFLPKPTSQEIIRELRKKEGWDVFFFAGHSKTEGETGRIDINENQSLEIEDFKNALREAIRQGLKIAIFNSCDGLGLAQKLADLQIPFVIFMQESVPDVVAQSFVKEFLKEYSTGVSLPTSVRRAQARLEEFQEWPGATLLPVVCQNPTEVPPTWKQLGGKTNLNSAARVTDSYLSGKPVANGENVRSHSRQIRSTRHNLRTVFLLSLAVTFLVMGVRWLGSLESLEMLAYDYLMSRRSSEPVDHRLLVIEVTDRDTDPKAYGYPVKDATVAKAIQMVEQGKPRVIGLDMHRSEPREPGHKELIARFRHNQDLFTVCAFGYDGKNIIPPPPELSKEPLRNQLGFSDLEEDKQFGSNGRIVRRQLLSYDQALSSSSPCNTSFSFSFQLAYRFLEAKGKPLTVTENTKNGEWQYAKDAKDKVVIKRLLARTGGYQHLKGLSNQILLNYRSNPKPAQRLTLTDLLEGRVDPVYIKDRVILIGYTAASARDNFDTPYGELAGVWIHAHMVSQMLSAVLDEPKRSLLWVLPQWGALQWGDALWVWSWSLTVGLLAWRLRSLPLPYLVLVCGTTVWLLQKVCLLVLTHGGWMPFVPSVLSLVATGSLVIYTAPQTRQQQASLPT